MRMKDEEWDSVIATNLTAVGRLSRAGSARHDESQTRAYH